jgi:DNA-binding NarL/FixJ family response regulator
MSPVNPPGRKALIVEDHPIVAESLFRFINESFSDITCVFASTGMKGLAYLNGNHFDIILLDINLPDISGIDFCIQAKTRFTDLNILMITSMIQRHIVEKSLLAGARGFVLKTSDLSDIAEAIKQVLQGNKYLGRGVAELIQPKSLRNSNERPVITRRECEILKLIADGFTNQEIADQLFISNSTVDSHRKNLLLKFDSKNSAMLVKKAISKGII